MQRYAIPILPETLPLIALLNDGVRPKFEMNFTYFIIDADFNSDVPNEIVTEETLIEQGAFENALRPSVYLLR